MTPLRTRHSGTGDLAGDDLLERIFWFIRLRWLAVGGVILTVLFAGRVLKIPLPVFPLLAVALALAGYNLISYFLLLRVGKKEKKIPHPSLTANRMANLQISFDLVCLVALIHFSGGIENPFIFYFVFHMIIAGILLSRRASFLQATFAVFLFTLLVILEYLGVLRHYPLQGFIPWGLYHNPVYVTGVSFVFISTLYIAVYMTASISGRLRERERSLKEANELLTGKDRVKSEYVLRVSHDIKEHLGAIQSCIEPVTGGITGTLNAGQADLLRRALRRTGSLIVFVKELLEITRIKLSKTERMEYFSFQEMLSDIVAQGAAKAKDKNISLSSAIDPSINRMRGFKEYIQESVSNLLTNSIKYTPRNGRIDIIAGDQGNSILLQVKDTGIGIPKVELPKIFEEFYRASNAKEVEKDGTGLGLSIARQVVERHGGRIWAESEEGKGSIFNMVLPK